jgi:hypothetical protein
LLLVGGSCFRLRQERLEALGGQVRDRVGGQVANDYLRPGLAARRRAMYSSASWLDWPAFENRLDLICRIVMAFLLRVGCGSVTQFEHLIVDKKADNIDHINRIIR